MRKSSYVLRFVGENEQECAKDVEHSDGYIQMLLESGRGTTNLFSLYLTIYAARVGAGNLVIWDGRTKIPPGLRRTSLADMFSLLRF